MDQEAIIWQIKARMQAKSVSKEKLYEVGIKKRTWYLVSTGRQKISLDLIKKLASVLKCKMEDLLIKIPTIYK
mgnify:FL=1